MFYKYLKWLLKTKGVQGVDSYILSPKMHNLSNEQYKDFVLQYLNEPFCDSLRDPFIVFMMLDNLACYGVDLEEAFLKSKYFETIPENQVILGLCGLLFYHHFRSLNIAKEMLAKIKNLDVRNECIGKSTYDPVELNRSIITRFAGTGLEDLILNTHDIEYCSRILYCTIFPMKNFIYFCKKAEEILSGEELRKLYVSRLVSIKDMVTYIRCSKGKEHNLDDLDLLFDVAREKDLNNGEFVNGELIAVKNDNYRELIDCLHKSDTLKGDKLFDEGDYNYLALKVVETNDVYLILRFISYIECPNDECIIDKLLSLRVPVSTVLRVVNDNYLQYAVSQYIDVYSDGLHFDQLFKGDYDIERLDNILMYFYNKKRLFEDFWLEKDTLIYLLKKGVALFNWVLDYFNYRGYTLTIQEEREILEALEERKLQHQDKNDYEEKINKNMELVLSFRKNN